MNRTTSLRALAAALSVLARHASALLPIDHLDAPTALWNQAIRADLGNGNAVQISPDDMWVYVTSSDGSLSMLDPDAGNFDAVHTPERRRDDGAGGQIAEDAQWQWAMKGLGGIAFHHASERGGNRNGAVADEGGWDGSYLVYWVFDTPPPDTGLRPSSRVIAIKHDASKEIEVLWTKVIEGSISGMPVIGSDGKFIYLTMNSDPAPPPTPRPTSSPVVAPAATGSPTNATLVAQVATDSPTVAPVATVATDAPTASPVLNTTDTSDTDADPVDANPGPAAKVAFWWAEPTDDGAVCVKNADYPDSHLGLLSSILLFDTVAECCAQKPEACGGGGQENRRDLQLRENSGYFLILDHALDGEVVYRFESRSVLSIQQHHFAPVEIAHAPERGNYKGGEGNANDVIMWGSLPDGSDGSMGDTMLFQLPRGFDHSQAPADTEDFEVQVLESVPWTTRRKPAISSSGMDAYFALVNNRITGWNKGQRFDVVANLGPQPMPHAGDPSGYAGRPIVLGDDDRMLIVTSPGNEYISGVDSATGGMMWVHGPMGVSPFTVPRISPDGAVVYFGKKNKIYSLNSTSGTWRWGEGGYSQRGTSASVMLADFSLSSTGEFLYYNGFGRTISAIRIADVVPTRSPVASPTSVPTAVSSPPPSTSTSPSGSFPPTLSPSPTEDPNAPSSSPTATARPSTAPSLPRSGGPTAAPSKAPTRVSVEVAGGVNGTNDAGSPTASPVEEGTGEPTPHPTRVREDTSIYPVDPLDPFSPGELAKTSNSDENSSPLSMTAIIGIAVGGGVGLCLLIGCILYVSKKKGSDDGLDTDWEQSNVPDEDVGAGEGGTPFSYGGGDDDSRQQNEGGPRTFAYGGGGDVENRQRGELQW